VAAEDPATIIQGEVPRFLVKHSRPPSVGTVIKRRMNNVGICMVTMTSCQSHPYYLYRQLVDRGNGLA
jgi:hypothetical protein